MIEVEQITKPYGERIAVDNLSFQVEKGEILGFLGPNGAGKTTTMRILSCYMGPTEGTARVAGFDVIRQPMEVKRRIGYLPEHPPLYREMTVNGYLAFVGRIRGLSGRTVKKNVDRAIDRCGLSGVRGRLIGNLSKGFQQRVGLAQAILHDPQVLILDEPTIGLDPGQIVEIRSLIQALSGEHTIILSTHILPEVQKTCQRLVIIRQGEIVAFDTLKGLEARFQRNDKIHLDIDGDPGNVIPHLREIPGVKMVQDRNEGPGTYLVETESGRDLRAQISTSVVKVGGGLVEFRRETMSLEEIFIRLTQEDNNRL
jgi:ABC-2 type transport system ATP-binding protein